MIYGGDEKRLDEPLPSVVPAQPQYRSTKPHLECCVVEDSAGMLIARRDRHRCPTGSEIHVPEGIAHALGVVPSGLRVFIS